MELFLRKYSGQGNDYLLFDPVRTAGGQICGPPDRRLVQLLCSRNFGVGSDGLLVGPIFSGGGIGMEAYLPDGTQTPLTASGAMVMARYLRDAGYAAGPSVRLRLPGGEIPVRYLDGQGRRQRALLPPPSFQSEDVPVAGPSRQVVDEEMTFDFLRLRVTCMQLCGPHCAIPLPRVSEGQLRRIGPRVEGDSRFPQRVNAVLLQLLERSVLRTEIFARGVGRKLTSGGGACAAAAAAMELGLCGSAVSVQMPGGCMAVAKTQDGFLLTGTVNPICEMTVDADALLSL